MEADPSPAISEEELLHYRDLARQYSKKSLLPLFSRDFPDGNLNLLPEKLEVAFRTGIAISPNPSISESTYGIWGSAMDDYGMIPSLSLLSTIAETCGGIAMCFHAQGMASNLITRAMTKLSRLPKRVGLGLQEGVCPPFPGTINTPYKDAPARVMTVAVTEGNSYIINGAKSFVYSMEGVDTYVVLARVGDGWGCFLVSGSERGVKRDDVGGRTGLRACRLEHVEFSDVAVPSEARLDSGDAHKFVIRAMGINWAGISAIALGIAKGAAASAYRYVAERYQGGSQIEYHPAVQMLLGGAVSAIQTAESIVFSLKECSFSSVGTLVKVAAAKVAVTELCAQAVTDCLQTFGGYGYMEDFGMEKRLRDITVLKSASGSPTYLKQFIFRAERGNLL